jgi:hypothetical protein
LVVRPPDKGFDAFGFCSELGAIQSKSADHLKVNR